MKKILVVEDSTEIRTAVSGLIDNGHSIIHMDADSYPDRFSSEGSIDIALIEMSYPFNRRYDLIQAILDINHDAKIILVVDLDLFNLAKPFLLDDLFDYLVKPIDTDKLKEKIDLPIMAGADIEFTGLLKKIVTEMAHRIKNPLTAIKTFTSLLEERFDDPEFRGEFYRLCLKEVDRIDEIIERMISYSALEKPVLAPADLNSTIKDVTDKFVAHHNYKDIKILLNLKEDIPPVLADRTQVKLILENIFLFASMDMQNGKYINIRYFVSSLGTKDSVETEISYPFKKEDAEDKDLVAFDLFLAREAIGHQGGELNVLVNDREKKIISINLPCCIGIEGMMRLDFNMPAGRLAVKNRSAILNYYDRRIDIAQIQSSERRIGERRSQHMSLYIPEKRRVLGVFTYLNME